MNDPFESRPLRILMVAELWQGSNSYALMRALRRKGHSVTVVSEENYGAVGWRSKPLRAIRRLLKPFIIREFNTELQRQAQRLQPHLLLICKGVMVQAQSIEKIRALGTRTILWWPDVSMFAHGSEIPLAVPHYDWIFTTKTFGLDDLRNRFGVTSASFIPHAYDPETHRPFDCDADDVSRYSSDLSFIGTWSPKKQALLEAITAARPAVKLAVWGADWGKAGTSLSGKLRNQEVFGAEYAKAIRLSRINLGLLSEQRAGASDGDRITSRTFHIPAAGGFMLHERSAEIEGYFADGRECALFGDVEEAIARIDHYLADEPARAAVAAAGLNRSLASGYSVDDRAATILARYAELACASQQTAAVRPS